MSQIVLHCLQSTSVLLYHIDVVLALSIMMKIAKYLYYGLYTVGPSIKATQDGGFSKEVACHEGSNKHDL